MLVHKRLSNFTLKVIKVKEYRFFAVLHFRVNNEHDSNTKMIVKYGPKTVVERHCLVLSISATSGHLCRFDVFWCIELYFQA